MGRAGRRLAGVQALEADDILEIEGDGSGGRIRTGDLRIMIPLL